MFNAKDLLEAIMRGGQPAPQQQSGGVGGLGDILGQIMGGGQKPPSEATGGGIGDILAQIQKQMGGAGAGGGEPQMSPQQQGGGGGLGDILGQLQKQLGGAGGGQAQAPQSQQGQQGGGGLMDVLGNVFGQAKAGVQEGAGRLNDMTGAGDKAREAMGQATGSSPEELLAQLQEWMRNNPGAAMAGAGGLGAVVLGTKAGRSLASTAAKLGGLALIGGLAYKAFQNYQEGRPPIAANDPRRLVEAPPAGTGFEPAAISNDTATLYIRAMIGAAAADGRIDANEQKQILGSLQQAGAGEEAQAFLRAEIENPASAEDLAGAVTSPAEAAQVYTAARIAIDPDTHDEVQYLGELAQRLGIDAQLAAHIDANARAAAA